jgi:hypothetical protein
MAAGGSDLEEHAVGIAHPSISGNYITQSYWHYRKIKKPLLRMV